jgi:hypothetical protein
MLTILSSQELSKESSHCVVLDAGWAMEDPALLRVMASSA